MSVFRYAAVVLAFATAANAAEPKPTVPDLADVVSLCTMGGEKCEYYLAGVVDMHNAIYGNTICLPANDGLHRAADTVVQFTRAHPDFATRPAILGSGAILRLAYPCL